MGLEAAALLFPACPSASHGWFFRAVSHQSKCPLTPHWSLSDFETNRTRSDRYMLTQTLLRSNDKVPITIRTCSHVNFSKALFPISFPLLASGHSASKKIRKKHNTKQNKTTLLWMLSRKEQPGIHSPTRQSTRMGEVIRSYPRLSPAPPQTFSSTFAWSWGKK